MASVDKVRDEFEAVMRKAGLNPERWKPDPTVYVKDDIQFCWNAWLASRNQTIERVKEAIRNVADHMEAVNDVRGMLAVADVLAELDRELGEIK